MGDERRGVGQHLVGRRGGHDHQVKLGGPHARPEQRTLPRTSRMAAQALVRLGDVPRVDAGAALNPARAEPEMISDRVTGHDPFRNAYPDGRDGGALSGAHCPARALNGGKIEDHA